MNSPRSAKLTVNDQNLLGGLFRRQSIENRVYCFTKDGTVCSDLLRGTKVLVFEGAWFHVVQDIAGDIRRPTPLFEVFQSRLDRNSIVGMATTLDVRNSLNENGIINFVYSFIPRILTGAMGRFETIAAGPL